MFNVKLFSSMSHKTGLALLCITEFIGETKVTLGTITSSFFFKFNELRASVRPAVQLLTARE